MRLFFKTFGIKIGSLFTLYCNSFFKREKDPEEKRNIRTLWLVWRDEPEQEHGHTPSGACCYLRLN